MAAVALAGSPVIAAPPALGTRRRSILSGRCVAPPRRATGDSGETSPTLSEADAPVLSPEDLVKKQYEEKEAENFGDSILGGRSVVEGTEEETRDLVPFGANNLTVLRATKLYADAIENGLDGDDVLCFALGVKSLDALAPAQRAYSEKVRVKLEENAQRLRGATLEAMRLYKTAVKAYAKGMYSDSIQWCDAALEETDPNSLMGGKIQIQKALGLDANGKEDDALEVYRGLQKHPEGFIKRQAEELKYILEAPKMEIAENEKPDVPLLRESYGYSDKWSSRGAGGGYRGEKRQKSLEEEYGGDFVPDVPMPQNPFITVAGLTIAGCIAWYSTTLVR